MKNTIHAGLRWTAGAVLLALVFLCAPLKTALAMDPPAPGMVQEYKKDGTFGQRLNRAREIGNDKMSPALAKMLQYKLARLSGGGAARTAQKPPPKDIGLPTAGAVKVLVLCIRFNDYLEFNSIDTVKDGMFGAGKNKNYPYESLNAFYKRSSYNQLDIDGNVLGWTDTYIKRADFDPGASNYEQGIKRENIIEQALGYWDMLGHDFSQYDNDKDGKIDYFIVIWTGPHTGWSSFWWAYQTGWWADPSFMLDGKTLGTYVWMPESMYSEEDDGKPTEFRPRTVIHETGHALGLPDYYDYDGDVGPIGGVGGLDMMDSNWGDHNAFSKFVLDWITPTVYNDGDYSISLRQSDEFPDAALLMPEARPGYPYGEFFIAQNRNQQGNDEEHPGKGIIVWHVDSRLDGAGESFEFDNSYTSHKLIRLMEADGLEEVEQDQYAESGDYYRTGRPFGPETIANSKRYDGSDTGISIDNIGPPGAAMTLDVHITSFAAVRASIVNETTLTHIDVEFNRRVGVLSAEVASNYTIGSLGNPATAAVQGGGKTVRLTTAGINPAAQYTLSIANVVSSTGASLYAGNLPLQISSALAAPCYSPQRCVILSSCAGTSCSPLKRIDTSGGYPAARTGYPKTALAGINVYLLDSLGAVVGDPAATDADGNFTLNIDTYLSPVSPAAKYKIALKIPSAQSAGVPCNPDSLPAEFYGADCGVIVSKNILLKQDSTPVKISLPTISDATGGGAPSGNPNCDNVISMADYAIFKRNYDKIPGAGGDTFADFNGDGAIDMKDYTIFKMNYDKQLSSPPAFIANLCKP